MLGQVKDGIYWLPAEESLDWQKVRVWYRRTGLKRGWHCTLIEDGNPGMTFPLSPEVWKMLKTEADMANAVQGSLKEDRAYPNPEPPVSI